MRPLLALRGAVRARTIAELLAIALAWAALPPPAVADPYEWTRWGMPYWRTDFVQVYDPVRQQLVIHGGRAPGPDGDSFDTGSLGLSGAAQWQWRGYGFQRSYEAAIYDPPGDRMVIFGGTMDGVWVGDLRTLSLATFGWSGIAATGTAPPSGCCAKLYAGAFDSQRRRMLLVGVRGDTYILDLTANVWTAITDPASPIGDSVPDAATYDDTRDRLLITFTTSGTEVWQKPLSGPPTAWSQITTSGPLPPAGPVDALYEHASDRLDFLRPDGLWTLSFAGTPTWSHVSAPPPPPGLAANSYHVSLDAAHDRLLAHGGTGHNETWAYALGSDAWSLVEPGSEIPLVVSHAAVVVPALDAMLILRGNPTWKFALNGSGFSPLATSGVVPPLRSGQSAIFDPVRQRVLAFGGNGGGTDFNDLYALTLTGTPTWSPLATAGTRPSARSSASAIYDPVRDRMLVVGGGTSLSDVWALTLSGTPTWSQVLADGTIPGFVRGPAVYDSRRDRVVLTGSQGDNRTRAWALPLAGPPAWSPLAGGASIGFRYDFAAVYDSTNDRVLAYGGLIDTPVPKVSTLSSLSLAPEAWSTVSPAGFAPLPRISFTLVQDPRRARFVMYGGIEGTGSDAVGATWTSPAVWFLTDHGVPLDVPGTRPNTALSLAACRLVGADRVSVRYAAADPGVLTVDVLDIQGRRLGRGVQTVAVAGTGETTVALERAAAPGLAIVRIRMGARVASRKFVILR